MPMIITSIDRLKFKLINQKLMMIDYGGWLNGFHSFHTHMTQMDFFVKKNGKKTHTIKKVFPLPPSNFIY